MTAHGTPSIAFTQRWHDTFRGGSIGLLLVGNFDNTKRPTPLDDGKRALETRLRAEFQGKSRAELVDMPVLKAYRQYYKRFDKTYHVQLQLESVVHKGKPLPNVNPMVDANFMAELDTLVLTAGHDADLLEGELTLDASTGEETLVQMNGNAQLLKPNDMIMLDARGVVCTILYGQEQRTPISERTRRALYVAYAPDGVPVAAVGRQLDLIRELLRRTDANLTVGMQQIVVAGR